MSELCKEIWENGIHYALIGDYYFPDVRSPEDCSSFGRWADLHMAYMKENNTHAYVQLLMADRLVPYLHAFNMQAEERAQRLVEQMKRAEGVTETLKARDPMEWVRRMNGIAARAEESVLQEMVYR